jgi:S1-C subfamily serine protease
MVCGVASFVLFLVAGKAWGDGEAIMNPNGTTSSGPSTIRKVLSWPELLAKVSPSVVAVRVPGGLAVASGFLVSENGLVATNYDVIAYDVIEFKRAVNIVRSDGKAYPAKLETVDEKADLALLRIEGGHFPFLALAVDTLPPVGTTVYAMGKGWTRTAARRNPQVLGNILTVGMVSGGQREIYGRRTYLKTTAIPTRCFSGGPLVSESGEVVGVTTGTEQPGKNLNFAVPVSVLRALIQRHESERQAAIAAEVGGTFNNSTTLQKTIAACTQAIRLDPKNANAYCNRGIANAKLGNFHEAIADSTEAIRLDPKDATVYCKCGFGFAMSGKADKAIAACTEAIRLDPNFANSYGNRGWAYLEKGELDKAIADCTECIRLDRDFTRAYHVRGLAYAKMGETEKAKAEADLSKAKRRGSQGD